jgi:L-asparaginase / beta-aspartyl-peptidase
MAFLQSLPVLFLLLVLIGCQGSEDPKSAEPRPEYVLVIHGGAGAISREQMDPGLEEAYRTMLDSALNTGERILVAGGSALEAVTAAILIMEDSDLFNAGRGAVFTHEGRNELDASIMDGSDLRAGAVTGTTRVRNPILAARAVMEQGDHVFLAGQGADAFATAAGLDTVSPAYFFTERRWQSLQKALDSDGGGSHSDRSGQRIPEHRMGTVGAVALDRAGNLAAGTSTGGMTNKRWNRIGDAPVIGAGTYADNRSCAVSCTGHGEFFIRYAVAHELAARVRHAGQSPEEAADAILFGELLPAGGLGGLIAVDRQGRIALPYNTDGMYRGYTKPGERRVSIWEE